MTTVAVVGATGGIGRRVVRRALDAGHRVRGLAREPTVVSPADGLQVVGGDVLDPEALGALLQGADVVVSCLGNDRLGPMVTCAGTEALLDAMDAAQVRRLAVISSIGVGESRAQGKRVSRLFMALVVPTVLRRPFADLAAMEEVVRRRRPESSTIVRPVALTNRSGSGRYAATDVDGDLGRSIPRDDVAAFLVDWVGRSRWDGCAVSLGPA